MELVNKLALIDTPSGKINVVQSLSLNHNARAVLCIHGFCCDSRIFNYISKALAAAGYDVYSIDLPGHGLSEGRRGDLDFESCLQSIDVIVSEIKKRSSEIFVLAHSMGSTFALWYAHHFKNSVDGLILLAPYIRIPGIKRSDAEPSPGAFLYLLIGRIFSPKKLVDIRKLLPGYVKIGGSQYSRMVDREKANFEYSFRYMIDIIAQRNSRLAELSDIEVPTFIIYGLQDRNVYPQVSEQFFKLVKSEEKKLASFDCNHWFYDAVFYSQSDEYDERDRKSFTDELIQWMNSQVERP